MTQCIVAHQDPLSRGFSREEHWSDLSFPSPGDLPNSGMETTSPTLAGRFFTTESPGKPQIQSTWILTLLVIPRFSVKVNIRNFNAKVKDGMPSLFTVSTQLPILMSQTSLHYEMLLPMVHKLSITLRMSHDKSDSQICIILFISSFFFFLHLEAKIDLGSYSLLSLQ